MIECENLIKENFSNLSRNFDIGRWSCDNGLHQAEEQGMSVNNGGHEVENKLKIGLTRNCVVIKQVHTV